MHGRFCFHKLETNAVSLFILLLHIPDPDHRLEPPLVPSASSSSSFSSPRCLPQLSHTRLLHERERGKRGRGRCGGGRQRERKGEGERVEGRERGMVAKWREKGEERKRGRRGRGREGEGENGRESIRCRVCKQKAHSSKTPRGCRRPVSSEAHRSVTREDPHHNGTDNSTTVLHPR